MKVNPKIPKTPSRVRSYVKGAADFVPKNSIFGINGITMVFCDCNRPALNGCLAGGRRREWPQIKDKNYRNSTNSKNSILWSKISSAHHNSLRAMEFLESLDLPSLSACDALVASL